MEIEEFNKMKIPRKVRLKAPYRAAFWAAALATNIFLFGGAWWLVSSSSETMTAATWTLVISGLVALGGAFNWPFLYLSFKLRLAKTGQMALAQVLIGGYFVGRTARHAKISFQTPHGEVIAHIMPGEFKAGDTIKVVYDPDLPSDVVFFNETWEVLPENYFRIGLYIKLGLLGFTWLVLSN